MGGGTPPLRGGMVYNPDVHHRRSIRLREYDYCSCGAYFLTACVHGRECLFGDVVDGVVYLTDAGRLVERAWLALPERFPHVVVDEHVVMPNHFHGIIRIHNVGAGSPRPASDYPGSPPQILA
jgi:putative transposase